MKKILHFITYGKAAAYIAALLYVAVWCCQSVVDGFSVPAFQGLLVVLVSGYLSVKVAREFSFGDGRNTLPATLFFMGCSLVPRMSLTGGEGMHLILFAVACYVLLCTFRDRSAMGWYFLAFALVGTLCLMTPTLLLALPWLVLCGAFMGSLHTRTLLAALWGLLCPFWMVGAVLFLMGRTGFVASYLGQILPSVSCVSVMFGPLQLWMPLLWVLLLAVPGGVVILLNRTMKLQTSAGLRFVIFTFVVSLVALCLSAGCCVAMLPSVLLAASLIGTGLFAGYEGRARDIYQLVSFVLWFGFLGLRVWNSLTMF